MTWSCFARGILIIGLPLALRFLNVAVRKDYREDPRIQHLIWLEWKGGMTDRDWDRDWGRGPRAVEHVEKHGWNIGGEEMNLVLAGAIAVRQDDVRLTMLDGRW